jgi:enoyl-CoA hydratase/carnithine racemase
VLDGGPLSPAGALELGLVDELVPPERLLDRALAVAARLGARPKAGVAACKRAVYEGGALPLADGLRLERSEFIATVGTADAEAAMASYQRHLKRTGELPGYDPEVFERALQGGRFSD